jgi:hypothetical protein
VLITEPFIPTARAIAEIRALPDYPFAVLKHPIGSLNEKELKQRAQEAALRIIEILLS